MVCENCGNKINESDKFCSNCGMHNDNSNNAISENNNEHNTSNNNDKLGLVSMILGVISILSIFIGLASGVYLSLIGLILGILSKNKDKKKIIGIILNIAYYIMFIVFYLFALKNLLTS